MNIVEEALLRPRSRTGLFTLRCEPTTEEAKPDRQPQELQSRIERAWRDTGQFLESEAKGQPYWTGELSTSALSTATAVSALVQVRKADPSMKSEEVSAAIEVACDWLVGQQNLDGGFGDTDRSHSNVATTYLVIAAWTAAGAIDSIPESVERARKYVREMGEWEALRQRYGKDKTFVVPILSSCALAGLVPWERVPALPFEAAWLPQEWYRLASMPVVSYAIPALVAIGQARHHFAPSRNPLIRALRNRAAQPTLRVLERMQPASGGYLEATPLTSFVLMNLAAIGQHDSRCAHNCLRFLLESRLEDGSWPIDTNLATWVTNLTLNAQAQRSGRLRILDERGATSCSEGTRSEATISQATLRWVLNCQHTGKHPFTGAQPGGWGWTNLSGAVPDSDDTPAALLALAKVDLGSLANSQLESTLLSAVGGGLHWLLQLQNRDGGWPTFCRGWGKLPFDRSGTDLTAHALRALYAWRPRLVEVNRHRSDRPISLKALQRAQVRGLRYIRARQQSDGSWLPLWFGNQDRQEEDNPIYGTSKVLLAYAELGLVDSPEARLGQQFLRSSQNKDGGWGGGESVTYTCGGRNAGTDGDGNGKSSLGGTDSRVRPDSTAQPVQDSGGSQGLLTSTVEETALALESLLACGKDACREPSIMRGLEWLCAAIENGHLLKPWPIGFYFAKLWYHERLYPPIFSLGALGAALRCFNGDDPTT